MKRGLRIAALVLIVAALAILTVAYRTATADPVVREAHLAILPPGERPLHVLLLSDIHVAGPDMPPERLAHPVAIANAQRPDLVLIAGDFVSDKRTATRLYAFDPAARPLAALRPRLGASPCSAITTIGAAHGRRMSRWRRRGSAFSTIRPYAWGRS